jgi:hypothetical protein
MRIATRCSNTYMDVERRIMKPNKDFELTVRDIEVIESALRAKAGRRGLAIAQGDVSEKLKEEMTEIQELLGRIHHQKVWYSPKDGKFQGGG